MENFFPIDNSFFNIKFDGEDGEIDITRNVESISVTEEIQKMTTGTIKINDPFGIYSRQLKNGKTFTLEWGYKKRGIDFNDEANDDELTGNRIRRGLRCFIQSPGGEGSNGKLTYSCNFYSEEFKANLKDTVWYRDGTKKQVVEDAFETLGVETANQYIDFEIQDDQLGVDNAVLQNETTFKFLVRLAFEWRCLFKIGYNQSGDLIGLFIDNSKINDDKAKDFQKEVTGGDTGSTKVFEYGVNSKYPNVISYSWKHNIGDSGLGDGNRIEIINGKTVITNYTVEDQIVKISKLNEARLKQYIKNNPDQKDLLSDIIRANDLDSKIGETTVSYFFDVVETTTAPQGLGYSADLLIIGDVLMSPTIQVKFGNGFPDMFKNNFDGLNKFYIKRVTHNINNQGYKAQVQIADVITTFGGFVT